MLLLSEGLSQSPFKRAQFGYNDLHEGNNILPNHKHYHWSSKILFYASWLTWWHLHIRYVSKGLQELSKDCHSKLYRPLDYYNLKQKLSTWEKIKCMGYVYTAPHTLKVATLLHKNYILGFHGTLLPMPCSLIILNYSGNVRIISKWFLRHHSKNFFPSGLRMDN